MGLSDSAYNIYSQITQNVATIGSMILGIYHTTGQYKTAKASQQYLGKGYTKGYYMKNNKKKLRDVRSIRMLFIFDGVMILALAVSFFYLGFFSLVAYIFLALLTICISLQLILYFIPKGELFFDASGITIITKKTNIFVCWNDVKYIYYNPPSEWFPLLNHCMIDMQITINGETIDFNSRFGDISVSKREYINIISFIPKNILESNDWMIYKNIIEKENNRYGI